MSTSNTIAAVASKAGVSISTVSRALRDDPRISAETIAKVKEAADKLGYRPNPYISVLMSHLRTSKPVPFRSTIALLDLFPNPDTWKTWGVHRRWHAGATQRAMELGYVLERCWAFEPGMTADRLTNVLQARGISGIIVPPDDTHAIYLTPRIPINVKAFSIVTLGAQYHEPDLHFCANDQFSSMRIACLQLLALGYKRIGLVAPRYIESIVDFRFGGAFLAVQMLEHSLRKVLPICYTQTRAPFDKWFTANKPDCILALDPTEEVMSWLTAMKVSVPQEVGFATLDCDDTQPSYSGINQNHEAVGASTIELLVDQITRNERSAPKFAKGVLIEGTWQAGKTTMDQTGKAG